MKSIEVVVGTFPDGTYALMLVCARLRYVVTPGQQEHINMKKHFETALKDVSIAD